MQWFRALLILTMNKPNLLCRFTTQQSSVCKIRRSLSRPSTKTQKSATQPLIVTYTAVIPTLPVLSKGALRTWLFESSSSAPDRAPPPHSPSHSYLDAWVSLHERHGKRKQDQSLQSSSSGAERSAHSPSLWAADITEKITNAM